MKKLLNIFFVFVVVTIGFALGQITFTSARAEAGTCCSFSSECPGTQHCMTPPNTLPCCPPGGPGCKGPGYCQEPINP